MEIRSASFVYVVCRTRDRNLRVCILYSRRSRPGCVSTIAAAGGEHTNVFVNCFCSDVVGGELCTTLKQKVGALSGLAWTFAADGRPAYHTTKQTNPDGTFSIVFPSTEGEERMCPLCYNRVLDPPAKRFGGVKF
jgi:hypothetical protein